MATRPPVKYRIGPFQEFLLKSSALTLDGIGLFFMLTLVGTMGTEAIGAVGTPMYGIWLWLLGVNFMTGNAQGKVLTLIINGVVEIVPFVNGVYPGFSVAVWRIVKIVKKEDEEKATRTWKRQQRLAEDQVARQRRVLEARARAQAARQAQINTQEQQAEAA